MDFFFGLAQDGNCQQQCQNIRQCLYAGNAVGTEEKGKGIEYDYVDGVLNVRKTGDDAFATFKVKID